MKAVDGLVYVTSDEMRMIDEETIEQYSVDVLSLMENAGALTAEMARRVLGGRVAGKRVACIVGKGNNGGDGLVAARHLHNWGAEASVVLSAARAELGDIPSRHLRTVEKMRLSVSEGDADFGSFDLIIDALLGYNARGDPREPVAGLIRQANKAGRPILALDIPSGLDPTSGVPNSPCIEAKATITLGFPKTGFLNPASRRCVGELYLGDVSIPVEVYRRHLQSTPPFESGTIVRVLLPP